MDSGAHEAKRLTGWRGTPMPDTVELGGAGEVRARICGGAPQPRRFACRASGRRCGPGYWPTLITWNWASKHMVPLGYLAPRFVEGKGVVKSGAFMKR